MNSRIITLVISIALLGSLRGYTQTFADLAEFENYFTDQGDVPKSIEILRVRLEQSREAGDAAEEALALRHLGIIDLHRLHDYEGAMDKLIRAFAIEDSLGFKADLLLTCVAIARVFEGVGDPHKSADFLLQAMQLNQSDRSIEIDAMLLTSLGRVHSTMGEYPEALHFFERVIRMDHDINASALADAYRGAGHVYRQRGHYVEALKNLKIALDLGRAHHDLRAQASILNDIGVLYFQMKNPARSKANHELALKLRLQINDKAGAAESYNQLGLLALSTGNNAEAIDAARKALGNAGEAQSRAQMLESYELLSHAYRKEGNFQQALEITERMLALQEFIQLESSEQQIIETQHRYATGRKEEEIRNLLAMRKIRDAEMAAERRENSILYVMAALIAVIALLILVMYFVQRRSSKMLEVANARIQVNNSKLQELNATKDRFFSIISHDLKGPLNSLTGFSRLLINHTDSLSKEEIRKLATDLDGSVRNLFALLENLLQWARAQTGDIKFDVEAFDIAAMMHACRDLLAPQALEKNIIIEVSAETRPLLVMLNKPSIETVIRNLMSNAIKFTRPGGYVKAGWSVSGKTLSITIEDNGVGMSPIALGDLFKLDKKQTRPGTANEKGTGLGLILCRDFVERNGGSISVESNVGKGTTFRLRFPYDKVATGLNATRAAAVATA